MALYVATTGSDSTGTGAQTTPYATIAHASALANPGTIVHVAPGTYTIPGGMITTRNGTASQRIIYQSDIIGGARVRSTGTDVVWDQRGNYVDVVGFDVSASDTMGAYGIFVRGSFNSIRQNRVHDLSPICSSNGGSGVGSGPLSSVYAGSNNDFIGNWCYNIGPKPCNFTHGIYATLPGDRVLNNISFNNGGRGIQLFHNVTGNTVSGNLVFGNGAGGGIVVGADGSAGFFCDNCIISNNISINNTGYGIYESGATGTNNQYLNNCVSGNSVGSGVGQISLQNGLLPLGTLTTDPLLVNYQADGSGDYHLGAASPCIDSGNTLGAPPTDYDGVPRPQGTLYDIGPYESHITDLYVATTGSDTNPGDATQPFATILHAANAAFPGITIHVAPGTYTNAGGMLTSTSGSATARLVYVSDTKWGAQIRSTGIDVMWDQRGDYVDVVGFDFSSTDTTSVYGLTQRGSFASIRGNRCHDIGNQTANCTSNGGAGISTDSIGGVYSGAYNDIIGNLVYNIGPSGACNFIHGIYPSLPGGNVQNNLVIGVPAWGIHLFHHAGFMNVSNNLVAACRVGSIQVGCNSGTCDWCTVNNNISMHSASYAVQEFSQTGLNNVYQNNLSFADGNANPFNLRNGLVATGSIKADPLVVNYQADGSGDYHIKQGSPAIGKGTTNGAPTSDYDGNPVPIGGRMVDIGPYQYPFSPSGKDGQQVVGGIDGLVSALIRSGLVVTTALDGLVGNPPDGVY